MITDGLCWCLLWVKQSVPLNMKQQLAIILLNWQFSASNTKKLDEQNHLHLYSSTPWKKKNSNVYYSSNMEELMYCVLKEPISCGLKGIVRPKIISSFTYPQVVSNLYEFLFFCWTKGRYFEECQEPNSCGTPLTSIVWKTKYYKSHWCSTTVWLLTFF